MTWLPRSLRPNRRGNPIRRGRHNARLLDEGVGLITGDGTPAPGGGSEIPLVVLPDLKADVVAYTNANLVAFANHCWDWAWLDGLVPYLQAIDSRVGFCWRPERNDISQDAVTYYHGIAPPVDGSTNVYVVDVIFSKCTAQAAPSWNNVTTPAAIREWRMTR
jgi:hypothetical protein